MSGGTRTSGQIRRACHNWKVRDTSPKCPLSYPVVYLPPPRAQSLFVKPNLSRPTFSWKSLLSHMLPRERSRSQCMWSKSPEEGLDEDKHVHCPRTDGTLWYNKFGEERLKLFWKTYIGYKEEGQRRVKWKQFWDRCIVLKGECLLIWGKVVGNSPESSDIAGQWYLVVGSSP